MNNKKKILIVCEGYEEYEYLLSLINLHLWNNYDIQLINAESNGNIFPVYQFYYQNDDYDLVLIMADTDRPTYNDFRLMINKINTFHGVDDFANEIVIFGNPCTMQFILNHFSNTCVFITKSNKRKNGDLIFSLTGIINYNAHKYQRNLLFSKIDITNYEQMKKNISSCSTRYDQISSTNFLKFILNFESKKTNWINKINKKL